MKNIKNRIIAGVSANAFGQAVIILIQLLSLPIFLKVWDIETYGVWLILSAFPAYLAIADIGILATAGNKMTIAMSSKKYIEANKIFQSSLAFLLLAMSFFTVLILIIGVFLPLPNSINGIDARIAIICLSLSVLVNMFGGLSDIIFKSNDSYALGTFMGNLLRLSEWAASMIGLAIFGSFSSIALFNLIVRIIGTFVITLISREKFKEIKWGLSLAQRSEIVSMLKPALAFMVFPTANAITFQGVTILAGILMGSSSVAIFNTYRTMARISVQANSVLSHALWPEFSKLFGNRGNFNEIISFYKKSFWSGVVIALVSSTLLYLLSDTILRYWSGNSIPYIKNFMIIMILYSTIGSFNHIPRIFLMSMNEHINLATFYFIFSISSIILVKFFGEKFELIGFGLAMTLSEIFLLMTSIYLCNRFILKYKN